MTKEQNPLQESGAREDGAALIDFKRIGYRALRYWYLVILSLMVTLAIAFYNNRYTQRIYPVNASLIIREREETSGAEILYKNALVDQYRNYLNEPYIIRSYPLIQRVVEDLNFTVSFYREGYVLTTEIYNFLPVTVKVLRNLKPNGGKYIFTIKDEHTYTIEVFGHDEVGKKEFSMGDSIQCGAYELLVEKIEGRSFTEHFDVPYVLVIRNSFQVADEYVNKLKVTWAEEGSGIVNLVITGSNPKKEIDFMNGLMENYQNYDLEKKNQTADRTVIFIKNQLFKISDSLKLFEGQLQKFKKDNNAAGDMSHEAQRIYSKVEALEIQRAELLVKGNYYDYLIKYISESKNLEQVILPTSLGITDPVLTNLMSTIIDIQVELKLFLNPEKTSNPLISNKVNRLNELKRDVVESVGSLRSTDKIKLDFLNKQISDVEKQIGYLPLAERQLVSIQRNYSLLENLYVFLMQKMSEAEISKASNVSDIAIVNPPMQGGSIYPNTRQNYLIALFFGLAIPMGLFVLFEALNNKIQSKEDVERITDMPFIGGMGHNSSGHNLQVIKNPKSSIAESFRALRSNLNYFTGSKDKTIFLITSSISGEGKTFTAINLASVFALAGKKTLILGADLRKPKLFGDFNISNTEGLSSYLAGISDFEPLISKTEQENLFVITGGPVPPNPSELLLTKKLDEFFVEARKRFDCIIIDSPPLALVTDAFSLVQFADHTVFLVRQNYTPKGLLMTIKDYYSSGKLKNVSILMNDIYKSGPGYGYGYTYSYGYNYGYGYGGGKKEKNGYGYYADDQK